MPKVLKIELTAEQRKELEQGYKHGNCHAFRQRCRIILLKSEGYLTREIVRFVNISNEHCINDWIKRYTENGFNGLKNKPGSGRKPILGSEDEAQIRLSVQKERQRLSQAKLLIEEQTGKSFDLKTLKRFLKNLSADIDE